MAVTTKWYGTPVKNLLSGAANGVWDWDTDSIKFSLHTVTYTPNQDTDDFFNDATNELATAGGYTAGGVAISTPTVTYDSATNETRLDCVDPSWSSASFTARYMVAYKSTGTASTSAVIGYIDFGADQTVSSGTFSIVLDSTGMFKATAS